MPRDEDRVFDVSKPQRTGPSPTSRPIIVGHHPIMNDPMMRDDTRPTLPFEHRAIPVLGADENPAPTPTPPPIVAEHPESVAAAATEPPAAPTPTGAEAATATTPPGDLHLPSLDDVIGHDGPHHLHHHSPPDGHVTPMHGNPHKSSGKKGLWLLLILLVIFAGAYLSIDSRLIKTSIKLPFHIFKQPAPVVTPATVTTTAPAVSAIPSGFTAYKLAGTTLSFDYPTTWGAPALTSDPGFSTRSATAKSDGTYAYLVNFATNKDIQIAVTSAKFLPAARGALYYDYLQWCVGSNDAKFYKSQLNFTTANKVDTPSTTTCDQGPLADATKLNSFTIEQLKTTNPDGSALGDLYSVNLKESDLQVLRVKDASSSNGVNIKKLLATIKSSDTDGKAVVASQ